jgi:peptidoglycan hydrolase-like protein with peptidoglycan-binding domain
LARRRVLAWAGGGVALLLVAGGVTAAALQPWRAQGPDDPEEKPPTTVVVERTTLTADLVLNGTLSYGDAVELQGRGGTVTGLPAAGAEVAVGQSLYEVDGRPVIAVRGDRPFWRSLAEGIDDGPDVQQLEQFLADSGFGDLTVDQTFTWATAAAVKDWQESLGLPRTGVVGLGDIVAVNAPSVRVSTVTAKLGESAGASPLSYTSPVLRVVAKLTDAQARELLPATPVTVTLPDGTEVPGILSAIDPGGVPYGTEGKTTPATASIELSDPTTAAGIGLRAVKVALASEEVKDALVVPVTALVATLDGGYAVDVVRDGKRVRVPVTLGLIADSRAQVVDGDLVEGDAVVVAE